MKITNATDDQLATSKLTTTATGARKYVPGGRVVIFGHAAHDAFKTSSNSYVDVPGTFESRWDAGKCTCRLEVAFAVQHDCKIGLRMCDPWNNQVQWEVELQGGHASNDWWSHLTTEVYSPQFGEPWPRQHCLQIRSIDGKETLLGSVILWIIDVM
jgi:hypothetical protein